MCICNGNDNLDRLAVIISICALVFSFGQFLFDTCRSRREATIRTFDELEENVFSKSDYKEVRAKSNSDDCIEVGDEKTPARKLASVYLSRIEHFAVGVNSGVYSLGILNRMAGGYMIEQYNDWKEYIDFKRESDSNGKYYDEFELLVNKLIKIRKRKSLFNHFNS